MNPPQVGETVFTGNPGGPAYIWNNLFYNLQAAPALKLDARSGTSAENRSYIWNNTFVGSDNYPLTAIIGQSDGYYSLAVIQNNHFINSTVNTRNITTVTMNNNVSQTIAQATAAGYTINNLWRPASPAAPTVDVGVRLDAAQNTDILDQPAVRGLVGMWAPMSYSAGGPGTNGLLAINLNDLDFGFVLTNSSKTLFLTVSNAGGGMLEGVAP